MDITIFAGKGGVGKSTLAGAYALNQSEENGVFMVDYDGGHSLTKVLALDGRLYTPNVLNRTGIKNLSIAVLDCINFEPIEESQKIGKNVGEYLSQFRRDYGLIPFCDMITTFFGGPTDIVSTSKFSSLIEIYYQAKEEHVGSLIIDVEPTAGLERLLKSTSLIARSIQNLQKTGWLKLKALGMEWPDIAAYLRGDYITNANKNAIKLEETANALKTAEYTLVCMPLEDAVDQIEYLKKLVISYGGTITGYAINNIMGEPLESEQIQRVCYMADGKPVVKLKRNLGLLDRQPDLRREALKEAGRELFRAIRL